MRRLLFLAMLFTTIWNPASAQYGGLRVRIDLSQQLMTVSEGGALRYAWPVSTARRGYQTPVGTYHPQRLEPVWYSSKYDWAPMPHAIFFRGGYAIHGTYETRWLGRPVSHGCVRLSPGHARRLYDLVEEYGHSGTTIVVTR
ncbi:L,D-transpeptidase [Pseudaminobacter sp. 19-2017]|uniref:L,D-transpeptidase n=1 Tax=Pseudaminobacter soli (ex Zhang et al. 2022) TaxID=2831468 RepID=A0A942E4Q4_9HYPH|nr:L,D-transpeptidase [Pseudaminobacter soli]MBS3650520.1 L,D-transpeptidase [Pseudaminobacter soli]